nr:MAG TPA: Receptor Binding Protein [Caudoviricetes sp.]
MLNTDSFTATTNGDNTITVGKGVGCIHVTEQWAAFPLNEGDVLLTFADADGVYPRWDVIALVYDKNANTAGLEVRTGLAAETPALPALRRNDDYDEIFLYRVTRPTGATKISADNVVDLRLDGSVCGLMRDTIDAIDTRVMQAAFEAFLTQIETELKQLHAGTSAMMRATYDPQGRQTDIFKAIDKVSNIYYATLTLDGWTACSSADKANELLYQQTATLTCANSHAPVVTASSEFLSGIGYDKTGVPATDDVLNEVQDIINDGVTVTAYNSVLVKVKKKPTAEIRARWVIQS